MSEPFLDREFQDDYEDQIATLTQELATAKAEVAWTRIDEEAKFDKSLDYLLGRPLRSSTIIRGDDFQRKGAAAHLRQVGWTHYRPINPPEESQ